MGIYSNNITERFQHAKITEGYCVICGTFGKLSQDHVPPKGSIIVTKVEQRHSVEMMGAKFNKIRGLPSKNGSKFKTICGQCNNKHLGKNDIEIAKVMRLLTTKILNPGLLPFDNFISVPVSAVQFARAMVGHILSATSIEECKNELLETPYFTPLREFVLGNDQALNDTHDIYYWFYPFSMHISSKMIGFRNNGHLACLSLLSFYPIAFMVIEKDKGIYPAHSSKLKFTDSNLTLNLSQKGFEYSQFPFHGLKGDQALIFTDYQSIVSYPIKD